MRSSLLRRAGDHSESGPTIGGSIFLSGISRWIRQAVNVVTALLMIRLLPPEAFGLFEMSFILPSLFALVADVGMGQSLVRIPVARHFDKNIAFWVSVATGGAWTVFLILLAPLLGGFFNSPTAVLVIRSLASGVVLAALSAVPMAILVRRWKWVEIARIETVAVVSGGLAGMGAAMTGWGVWSLVVQWLVMSGLTTILSWRSCGWCPTLGHVPEETTTRPALSRQRFRELVIFGRHVAITTALHFLSRSVDNILIGRFLGASALGYYAIGYRVMMFPLQNIVAAVTRVMFPVYASMKADVKVVKRRFLQAIEALAYVTFPVMVGLAVIAPEFTHVAFGGHWDPAVLPLRLLSIAGPFHYLMANAGSIFMAVGETKRMVRWALYGLAVYGSAILIGIPWGTIGVAACYLAASLLMFRPLLSTVATFLGGSFREIRLTIAPAFVGTCIMATVGLTGRLILLLMHTSDILLGIGSLVLMGVTYFFSVRHTVRRSVDDIRIAFRGMVDTRRGRPRQ